MEDARGRVLLSQTGIPILSARALPAVFRHRERRLALVIGNSAYEGAAYLPNPENDATAFGTALKEAGFQVTTHVNLTFQEMEDAIAAFIEQLEQSDGAEVALVYYSGHGHQANDINYLVPVGAESSDPYKSGKLIVVQRLIDRITEHSKKRLIILDACRTNPAADKITDDLLARGILIDGKPAAGLAEIEMQTNSFLAFSAAPGRVAYDGTGKLSPFTEALLKYIGSVDLPLTNLTARVRHAVFEATGGKQQTWDESSLTEPFFFNPSSQLLLIGNLLGLTALVASLIPYSLLLRDGSSAGWIAVGGVIFATALVLFLAGMNRAYARFRGELSDLDLDGDTSGRQLWRNARKGITGGVFGGMIAAFFIAFSYRADWIRGQPEHPLPRFGETMTEMSVAAIFVAAALGAFSLTVSDWFSDHRRNPISLLRLTRAERMVAGAVLGGLIAGAVTAPFVTLYFGRFEDRPFLTPIVMAPGAIFGAAIVSFSIVNYSLEQISIRRLVGSALMAIVATLVTGIVALILLGLLYFVGFIEYMTGLVSTTYYDHLQASPGFAYLILLLGGLVYGVVIGPILGLLIGLTLFLTQGLHDPKALKPN